MSSDKYLDEFPDAEGDTFQRESTGKEEQENRLVVLWESLSRAGLSETIVRAGTNLLLIVIVILVVVATRAFSQHAQDISSDGIALQAAALAAGPPTATPPPALPVLPPFPQAKTTYAFGIPRLALLHTTIPTRPRTEVTTYTVEEGDTIFGIAEKFGLNPETVLWGNYYILADNPHSLRPGQELNILPLNGTYHRWSEGEGLNGVARGYNVTPEEIINWPANHLDPETIGDWSHPNIEPGTMLVVPSGSREFITWSASRITRDNPGVARVYGPGFCGAITDGAVGTGWFVWPANNHFLSGYDYSPSTNHRAIDIDGDLGDPIYAADNGVIVYSGWNDHGYGYMVVIDHGNGWQTLYSHMSVITAGCGASVYQGGVIGSFGSTGNSTGPHLHFEMMHDTYGKVNPWDFLPPP